MGVPRESRQGEGYESWLVSLCPPTCLQPVRQCMLQGFRYKQLVTILIYKNEV